MASDSSVTSRKYHKMERGKKRNGIVRSLGMGIISLVTFLIVAWFMNGVHVSGLLSAVGFVFILSIVNAYIRPFLLRTTLSVTILTLGIFSLIINATMISLAARIVPGIEVASFSTAVWMSIWLSGVTTLFHTVFAIDDVESYESYVLKKNNQKEKKIVTDKPGVVFLEIDGLSHPVIQRAIKNGYMPQLAKMLRTTHHLVGWECDFASSTPASQAGLLLGNNDDMPAFRWYDRKLRRVVSMSSIKDTVAMETSKTKKGDGLLSRGGASINNMFSGGAKSYVLTSSKLTGRDSASKQPGLYYFFANFYNFARTLFLFFIDIYYENKDRVYQARHDVWPRLPFHFSYPFVRAITTVIMREVGMSAVIGKMMEGVPSMYATLVAYDEIAHHSGVERSQAMYMLQQLDKQFAKVMKATEYTPRPYHLVFLSDHGQSQGATFLQRYDQTLEEYIETLVSDKYKVMGTGITDESWDRINTLLTDTAKANGLTSKVVSKAVKSKTKDGEVIVGPKDLEVKGSTKTKKGQRAIEVLASGNLGLLYFTESDNRMSMEAINTKFPNLIPGLVDHEGIGFVVVKSGGGTIVLGEKGTRNLDTDKVVGEDPLKDFDVTTVIHLKRQATFNNLPDILINSFYDSSMDEIAAFEELIGAHGGIGGAQNKPFLMYPKALENKKLEGMISTIEVHKVLKKWAFEAA